MVVNFNWTLEAYESQGYLWLRWNTSAPFSVQQGQIRVYQGSSFPSDPTGETKVWCGDNQNNLNWNTGLPWGTGWNCAWIAKAPNGSYVYVVKITTNKNMGPDVVRVKETS